MPLPIFWFFALLMLFGALSVVLLQNPVASAMSMLVSFIGLAALFVGLNAYFAGIIQILVYAGAIMVLFIFIIMLLDLNTDKKRAPKMLPLVAGLGIVIAFTMQLLGAMNMTPEVKATELNLTAAASKFKEGSRIAENLSQNSLPDVHLIGQSLFTEYNLPLQILGTLLLVATVGVVLLSKKQA